MVEINWVAETQGSQVCEGQVWAAEEGVLL